MRTSDSKKSKSVSERIRVKEMAYAEFRKGQSTQRDIAGKYGICETELSRFFSEKLREQHSSASI